MSRHYGNFDSGNGNGLLQTTRGCGSESWTAAGLGASAGGWNAGPRRSNRARFTAYIAIEFSRARSLETYRSSNHGQLSLSSTSGLLGPGLDDPVVVSAAGGPRHRVTATSPDSHDGTCPLLGGESSWWRVGSLAHSVLLVSSRAPRRASHDMAESKGPSRIVHDQSAAGATRIQRANPRLIPNTSTKRCAIMLLHD